MPLITVSTFGRESNLWRRNPAVPPPQHLVRPLVYIHGYISSLLVIVTYTSVYESWHLQRHLEELISLKGCSRNCPGKGGGDGRQFCPRAGVKRVRLFRGGVGQKWNLSVGVYEGLCVWRGWGSLQSKCRPLPPQDNFWNSPNLYYECMYHKWVGIAPLIFFH